MSAHHEIRRTDYVGHPYEAVRDLLHAAALDVFQAATKSATKRAHGIAAALHVNIGALQIDTDISIRAATLEELPKTPVAQAASTIDLEWEATRLPRLFPFMRATLAIFPLTASETQLEFFGTYEPPLGRVGEVINAVVGHRIAEAAVQRFVEEVARHLRDSIPAAGGAERSDGTTGSTSG